MNSQRKSYPLGLHERFATDSFKKSPSLNPPLLTSRSVYCSLLLILCVCGFASLARDYLNLKGRVTVLEFSIEELQTLILETRTSSKSDFLNMSKEIDSMLTLFSHYNEQRKALEDETSVRTLNLESTLELLRNDLLYSVQNSLVSFYNENFARDFLSEKEKLTESMKSIESLVFRLAEERRAFEDRFRTVNVADRDSDAKIIDLIDENFTWTSAKYQGGYDESGSSEGAESIIDSSKKGCFRAEGGKGVFTVQLKERQRIFGFAYEQKLGVGGDLDAVKNFQVFGLMDKDGKDPGEGIGETLELKAFYLGSYGFTAGRLGSRVVENDERKQSFWKVNEGNRYKQYFVCGVENCERSEFRTLRVEYENYGEKRWTAICRFEVLVKVEKSFRK